MPAILIGSALLWYYNDKMESKRGHFNMEPMIIFPKGMEKKAKAVMKEVKKVWEEIM